jgi:hypothetical protein
MAKFVKFAASMNKDGGRRSFKTFVDKITVKDEFLFCFGLN